jgi:transcription elongation factor GreA-like protein
MSEQIWSEIQKILEAEKWNRFQLGEYNVAKFQSLEGLMAQAHEAGLTDRALQEAKDVLKKNEYHFSAQYMIILLDFLSGADIEASLQMQKLVNIFRKKEKNNIVEYLCRKTLEFGDDAFALRGLIGVLRSGGKSPELESLQERLIGIEPSDNEMIIQLASTKEKNGKAKDSLKFYLMGLNNFIRERLKKQTEETWHKITALAPTAWQTLLGLEHQLTANFDKEFVYNLLTHLIHAYPDRKDFDTLISLYKKVIAFRPDDKELRNRLIELYSQKHETHSQLNQFIIYSGLKQWWQDIFQAVDKFEQFIRFDVGRYVWHQSWGVGKVTQIQESAIYIDFEKDSAHKMTFDMALSSLQVLSEDHIKVCKKFRRDETVEMMDKQPLKVVSLILQGTETHTSTVDSIRSEVTDGLLAPDAWNRWWNHVKKQIKLDDHFDFSDNKTIRYIDNPVSFEDHIRSRFEAHEELESRLAVINDLLNSDKSGTMDKAFFRQAADWFLGRMNEAEPFAGAKSWFALQRLGRHLPELLKETVGFDLKKRLPSDDDLVKFFGSIEENETRKAVIAWVEKNHPQAAELYLKFLYTRFSIMHPVLLEKAEKALGRDRLRDYKLSVIENYKDYPELFFSIGRSMLSSREEGADPLRIYTNFVYLISVLGRKVRNGENEEENTKLQKNIISLVFSRQEPNIFTFVVKEKKAGNPKIANLVDLVIDNTYLPEKHKKDLLDQIRSLENIIIA